jgi:hypothetical protein
MPGRAELWERPPLFACLVRTANRCIRHRERNEATGQTKKRLHWLSVLDVYDDAQRPGYQYNVPN